MAKRFCEILFSPNRLTLPLGRPGSQAVCAKSQATLLATPT